MSSVEGTWCSTGLKRLNDLPVTKRNPKRREEGLRLDQKVQNIGAVPVPEGMFNAFAAAPPLEAGYGRKLLGRGRKTPNETLLP